MQIQLIFSESLSSYQVWGFADRSIMMDWGKGSGIINILEIGKRGCTYVGVVTSL